VRVSDYSEMGLDVARRSDVPKPPASYVAAKIIGFVKEQNASLAFVALSENAATSVAEAARCLAPDLDVILFPPWDCLPYDRVPPSRQCMGRRMDALRVWSGLSSRPRLLVTSLDAVLQKIPPLDVVESSWFEVTAGKAFDLTGFKRFVQGTGYLEDGLVDEPGEFAFRDDVIDIFPAGQLVPMRVVISEEGMVAEVKVYNPNTQRTDRSLKTMLFGPASEAIAVGDLVVDGAAPPNATERGLIELYGDMPNVFDLLGTTTEICFAPGSEERVSAYLDFIEEARQAYGSGGGRRDGLYLNQKEWCECRRSKASIDLDFGGGAPLPNFFHSANPRKTLATFVEDGRASMRTIVLLGGGRLFDDVCRRILRHSQIRDIDDWSKVGDHEPGSVLKLSHDLAHGFVDRDRNVIAITSGDILGNKVEQPGAQQLLAAPELMVGDVVVHEDHGVGILRGTETVDVEGVVHDAARLEYHGGASILVPMQDFGRLWRYSSEPQAVALDRLHTEAWKKKREAVAKDIRVAARHLMRLAEERAKTAAEVFVPPRSQWSKFETRFPYPLTDDQRAAISSVLDDLSSGKVMNRLVCGDVGFGKTEIALRAAAVVALSRGQVAIVVPTTVLARQHFLSFERRFAGTGVNVAMLSRVVEAGETKRTKAGLATGDVQVVVATHAILAKDVAFDRLGLLIIDEEHRFGTKDKAAMKRLAPNLHTLAMSATPIPRTLQAAMVGVQDVSLLTTPPSKRRPVRTSLSAFDPAAMRVALLREQRRGGQSFVVAPQIEDLDHLKQVLVELVPELAIQVAHGNMPAAAMDQIMVDFADGQGDVLLSTNIIESGLDVPRANTIFVWRADRFGLAQLHQLRGRVGRGRRQGIAHLLTPDGDDIAEETRVRLSAMVENDRLGAGLAISIQDLDMRGGGDIAGEDQAGHMKVIGIGLYQRLLERAVGRSEMKLAVDPANVEVNIGLSGRIPEDYLPDASVRLNLYARILRAAASLEIDELAEEFEDRFGAMPEAVRILLRLQKLKLAASCLGITKIDAGPRAMGLTFVSRPESKVVKYLSKAHAATKRDERLIYEHPTDLASVRLEFLEEVFAALDG